MYEEETVKLRKILGAEIYKIYHIDSTSVDGLIAKPVIDIMPVVRDVNRVDDFNTAMIDIGYEPKGVNGFPGRRFSKRAVTIEHTTSIFLRKAILKSNVI